MSQASRSFRSLAATFALALASSFSLACSDDQGDESSVSEADVIANYAKNVEANYADALASASELHSAVHELTEAPSAKLLKAARDAWLVSRDPYGESEAFRFYDGPIDNPEDGPEGLINAWPIDESYVDYITDVDAETNEETLMNTGIINMPDDFPEITEDVLIEANEAAGETSISTGYHAVEFLLWGQDKSADGPGERPHTDYLTDGDGTHENQDRRGQYLLTAADLLVSNLASVHEQWKADAENYRAEFEAAPAHESLLKMLTGMGELAGGELAQERMNVAYEDKDQENEHSCFSDNTVADLHNNAKSVQNVLLGKYGDNDGPGLDDLIAAKNPGLADEMREQIQGALDEIDAIEGPFDQAILDQTEDGEDGPNRERIANAISLLKAFRSNCSAAATELGLELTFE
jgi:putative iron-regulated protein